MQELMSNFHLGHLHVQAENKLPSAIKDIESLDTFKSSLYNYLAS